MVLPFSAGESTLPLEKMVHNLTARALSKSAMRPENSDWDFSPKRRLYPLENRRQPPELRSKLRPTPTIFTPGIPQWPSRDPIQEQGGVNLYGFVGNDGVGKLDVLGQGMTECLAALAEAWRYATQLLVPELDKYDPVADGKGGFPIAPGKGGGRQSQEGITKRLRTSKKG